MIKNPCSERQCYPGQITASLQWHGNLFPNRNTKTTATFPSSQTPFSLQLLFVWPKAKSFMEKNGTKQKSYKGPIQNSWVQYLARVF